ncbi:LysR family transcriptional regulator [Chromobacterium sp. IIBBL 290-4]|uniref:LysR family transcriptional regulator n=1 Tax=Chromobacterium sp. IIBBL 290-4 TaxID=2953890 RepID=UPI0020B8A409|nr:LysR family transcriptional regulator [Chromobacterium sp. IIBBL 290-4]UTH72988.1 LysR family transcriptional regulator [Chromobacterium sp. IIBBL 290-4]
MVRLDDLQVFIRAADHGSLSAAARQLDLSPAVASAALKRLEQAVGAQLLARSTRSLRLTLAGERYLEHARVALDAVVAGSLALAQDRQALSGSLSLSMPSDLGRNLLRPWLDDFLDEHAGLGLQLRISDRLADLYRQPVDVALRYGVPEDSSLVALPLAADNRRVLCASPEYLARQGEPDSPQALRDHVCLRLVLGDAVHERWRFGRDGESLIVPASGRWVSDDGEIVRQWALAGRGIAYKSRLDVLADLRAGRLRALLPDYQTEAAPLYLVTPHRLMLSPAVTAMRAYLQKRLDDYQSEP